MASNTVKDAAPKATVQELDSVSPEALPAGVVALGDVAASTQGGGGTGSDDKRYVYD